MSARWAETRGITTKWLMDDQVRDFFIAFARHTDLSTTPLVAFVKVDGIPVAAALNLVGPRSFECFITTYDEAYAVYSVGSLITQHLVRWAQANGRDFDFRYFHADWKLHWANHKTFYQTHLVFLNTRGRLMEIPLLARLVLRAWRKFRKIISNGLASVRTRFPRS